MYVQAVCVCVCMHVSEQDQQRDAWWGHQFTPSMLSFVLNYNSTHLEHVNVYLLSSKIK